MADPATLGAMSLGSTALGAVTSAFGANSQGQAQSQMYSYQQGVAQLNKKIALQNADYERSVGETSAADSGMKTMFQLGTQKAQQSASGLDVNSGSAADVRKSTEAIGELDQSTIRANSAKRAYGYEVGAFQDQAQADIYGMAADNASKAGKIGALTSLLGGASSVSSKWLQGNQVGLFGGNSAPGIGRGLAGA